MPSASSIDPFLVEFLGPHFRWAVTTSKTAPAPGFYQVDSRVTLERPAAGLPQVSVPAGYSVRPTQPTDEDQVATIAATSFSCSRFHNDPAIAKAVADKIKATWARNYFRGKRGDAMVVAIHENKVVGFCLLLRRKNVLIIDLIAVDAAHRQRGLASAMIAAAAATPGITRLRVGTQLANIPSLRAYEKLGFKVTNTEHVWHCHMAVV